MKKRTIVGLLLVCCAWGAAANAAQPATVTCDRECLRGKVTQLLYALLKHDVKESAGLTGANHIHIQIAEVQRMRGHLRLREPAATQHQRRLGPPAALPLRR